MTRYLRDSHWSDESFAATVLSPNSLFKLHLVSALEALSRTLTTPVDLVLSPVAVRCGRRCSRFCRPLSVERVCPSSRHSAGYHCLLHLSQYWQSVSCCRSAAARVLYLGSDSDPQRLRRSVWLRIETMLMSHPTVPSFCFVLVAALHLS